jgi:hypothetical protein
MRSLSQSRLGVNQSIGAQNREQGPSRERLRMRIGLNTLFLACTLLFVGSRDAVAEEKENAVIWSEPDDIAQRNLFYGSGGEQDQPHGTLSFLEEDHAGSNPKSYVRDQDGTKWTVKPGVEAKPETAAAHLLWAVGYYTDEDYFVPQLSVEGIPSHLQRGQNLIQPQGRIENVRLKRHIEGQKKVGNWKWKDNPFSRTRQFNGLRVMLALMNSWDVKDENNAIYERKQGDPREVYVVSDLGASFGTTGYSWTQAMAKGNIKSYQHSKFIKKVSPEFVDFSAPSRPALIYFFHVPGLIQRLRMRWVGRHIPREDAKWMGELLSHLSSQQIQDAFRSAGYSPQEIEDYTKIVQERIDELTKR